MKSLLRILCSLLVIFAFTNFCDAKQIVKMDKLLKSVSELDKTSTIAISVKDAQTGAVEYEYNSKKLLHTASTLKLFTAAAAIDTLGENYNFTTAFYKHNNDLYIKLGADPFLTTDGLKSLVKDLRSEGQRDFNTIYFDDSIFDRQEWGTGWMWDNDTNPAMPKFSSYNLDNNIIRVNIAESVNGDVSLSYSSRYPMSIVNLLSFGNQTQYNAVRYNWINPEVVELIGTVKGKTTVNIPLSSMRRYFIFTLNDLFSTYNIKFKNLSYASKLVPSGAQKIAEIATPAQNIYVSILQDSDNKNAETLFKAAAAKRYNATATTALEERFFREYWEGKKVSTKGIHIADGSGASRNDLFSVGWMTDALVKIYNNKPLYETLRNNMAQPGDGTLSSRLYALRGNVWLKTGTLSGISGLTGFVVDSKGKTHVVSILIQNFISDVNTVKSFEDEVIKAIYE